MQIPTPTLVHALLFLAITSPLLATTPPSARGFIIPIPKAPAIPKPEPAVPDGGELVPIRITPVRTDPTPVLATTRVSDATGEAPTATKPAMTSKDDIDLPDMDSGGSPSSTYTASTAGSVYMSTTAAYPSSTATSTAGVAATSAESNLVSSDGYAVESSGGVLALTMFVVGLTMLTL
jgi:hypothetical protein